MVWCRGDGDESGASTKNNCINSRLRISAKPFVMPLAARLAATVKKSVVNIYEKEAPENRLLIACFCLPFSEYFAMGNYLIVNFAIPAGFWWEVVQINIPGEAFQPTS